MGTVCSTVRLAIRFIARPMLAISCLPVVSAAAHFRSAPTASLRITAATELEPWHRADLTAAPMAEQRRVAAIAVLDSAAVEPPAAPRAVAVPVPRAAALPVTQADRPAVWAAGSNLKSLPDYKPVSVLRFRSDSHSS